MEKPDGQTGVATTLGKRGTVWNHLLFFFGFQFYFYHPRMSAEIFAYEEMLVRLQERLSMPLPGTEAQARMSSSIRTSLKLKSQPDEKTRVGAVCLLLYPHGIDWHIPLIIRPEYDGAHGGQISLPGGKVEQNDAGIAAAALREMQEEIGVDTTTVQVLGELSPLFIPASNFMVHPVVAIAPQKPFFQTDPFEVAGLLEIALRDLQDETKRNEKDILVRGVTVRAPYFDIQQQTIWGATAMILSELLDVLPMDR